MTKALPHPTGAECPKKVKDWVIDAPSRHSAPINGTRVLPAIRRRP